MQKRKASARTWVEPNGLDWLMCLSPYFTRTKGQLPTIYHSSHRPRIGFPIRVGRALNVLTHLHASLVAKQRPDSGGVQVCPEAIPAGLQGPPATRVRQLGEASSPIQLLHSLQGILLSGSSVSFSPLACNPAWQGCPLSASSSYSNERCTTGVAQEGLNRAAA